MPLSLYLVHALNANMFREPYNPMSSFFYYIFFLASYKQVKPLYLLLYVLVCYHLCFSFSFET